MRRFLFFLKKDRLSLLRGTVLLFFGDYDEKPGSLGAGGVIRSCRVLFFCLSTELIWKAFDKQLNSAGFF